MLIRPRAPHRRGKLIPSGCESSNQLPAATESVILNPKNSMNSEESHRIS